MKRLCVASCLVAIFGLCAEGESTVIPAPGGVGDVAAFEAAMQSASQGDEIILSKGVYLLDHTITNYNVSTGSWSPITVRGATGNRDDVIIDGQNACRCLYLRGKHVWGDPEILPGKPENAVRLRDLTIRNGLRQDETDDSNYYVPNGTVNGGGAHVHCGYVENCAFVNCHAKSTTAIWAVGGGLLANVVGITNCTFESCSAQSSTGTAYGGGVGYSYGTSYSYEIGKSTFTNCSVWVTGGTGAGMISCGGAYWVSSGRTHTDIRCYDCFATNSVGWNQWYHALGGAVACWAGSTSVFRDCYFTNCQAYGRGGAIWVNNSASITISNTTFVGNGGVSVKGVGGGAVSNSGSTTPVNVLENVLFAGNTGGASLNGNTRVRSCVFRNGIGTGFGAGLYAAGALDIADCVFISNTVNVASCWTLNGGALCCAASTVTETVRVERCVFDGNAAGSGPDWYYIYGGSALHFRGQSTNNLVRNCHFLRNYKSPVVVIGNPDTTFSEATCFKFENCSFVENSVSDTNYKYVFLTRFDKYCKINSPYLFLENCLLFENTGFSDGVFTSSFYPEYSDHVQYCASDLSTNFPADENGNFLITKAKQARNKGLNRDWMVGETDGGDGTYMITPYREYGVRVTINDVHKRLCGRQVDIGAAEHKPLGAVLIVK